MDPPFTGFPPGTLRFLTDLRRNNNRQWFQENRNRYEEEFLEPALAFIRTIAEPLQKISPCLLAVPKKTGGSLMRIYRDIRFSKDKTPYKTNMGIHFRHRLGRDVHAPGCYVHIEPQGVFLGVGIWRPESKSLLKIRSEICEDPAGWKKASRGKAFRERFRLAGDSLKRPPLGFDASHPMLEDLKRKDFIGAMDVADNEILDGELIKTSLDAFRTARPFMRFLCQTLGVPF